MKIKNLEDLKAYSLEICKSFPEDTDRSDLTSPLCDLELLKATISGLPESYLDVAKKIALKGKVLGYFSLWPEAFDQETLEETLVKANSETAPFTSTFRKHGCYQIATYEAEPIGIVREGEPNEGSIIKLDIDSPVLEISKLASSFEEFLLIAGSLDKAQMENQGPDALDSFLEDIQRATDKDIASNWRVICEVAFGC